MDAFEIIGAFVDSERVDPDALKAALSTDEGRQYLVDLVALRELTSADLQGVFVAPGTAPTTSGSVTTQRVVPAWLGPLAAAAAVIVALAGGYVAGRRAAPPTPIAASAATRIDASRPPAPVPTSVIKLEPGVDWHEQITRN